MHDESHQLTPQQVAQYCGVTAQTVNDWLSNGRLNADTNGSNTTVAASELIDFMDENHLAIPVDLLTPPVSTDSSSQHESAKEAPSSTTNTPIDAANTTTQEPPTDCVYIINTDTNTTFTIESVLKDLGLNAIRIESIQNAQSQLLQAPPRLITLELDPADTEGIELIEGIRNSAKGDQTKVLVLSSQMPTALVKAKSAGADAIVTKPFDNDTLKRTVRILLGSV